MDLNPCLRDITRFVQNLSSRKKGMFKPIQLKCFEAAIFYTGRVLWKSRNSKIITVGSKSRIALIYFVMFKVFLFVGLITDVPIYLSIGPFGYLIHFMLVAKCN